MSFIFSKSFRKPYAHANVPASLVDGQGSCVLCVGFTHAMFRIAIHLFLCCVLRIHEYREFMNIHTMHLICHVCLFPLLVTSITVVILRPSVIDFAPTGSYIPYPLNLVSWSVHCTPQNRSAVLFNFLRIWDRFCCFFFRFSFYYINLTCLQPLSNPHGKTRAAPYSL